MNERHPETTELDEATEKQIDYMMNTRGLSRADAKLLLLPDKQESVSTSVSSDQARHHPSPTVNRRNRSAYSRPPVGEDSEDVMTGILSKEQVAINTRGIRLAREALRANAPEPSAQDLAIARARQERRNRNY